MAYPIISQLLVSGLNLKYVSFVSCLLFFTFIILILEISTCRALDVEIKVSLTSSGLRSMPQFRNNTLKLTQCFDLGLSSSLNDLLSLAIFTSSNISSKGKSTI